MGKIKVLVFSMLFLCLFSGMSFAGQDVKTVEVEILKYPKVRIGSQTIRGKDMEYPILKYKKLVYFPLTSGNCEKLDWDISWSEENGLAVSMRDYDGKQPLAPATENYDDETCLGEKSFADIAMYDIKIGSFQVSGNADYPYPFLNFKGITYMPVQYGYAESELDCRLYIGKEEFSIYRNEEYRIEREIYLRKLRTIDSKGFSGIPVENHFEVLEEKYKGMGLEKIGFRGKVIARTPIHTELLIYILDENGKREHMIQCFEAFRGIDGHDDLRAFSMLEIGSYVEVEAYLREVGSNGDTIVVPLSIKSYRP